MKWLALVFGVALSVIYTANLCAQQTPQLPAPNTKLAPPVPPPEDFAQPLMKALDEAKRGNYDQAIADAERSRAMAEQQLGPNDETVGNIVSIIGQLHLANREYDKAKASFARVLQIEGKPTDEKSVDLEMADEFSKSGMAAETQDNPKYARATEFYQQALAIREKMFGHASVQIVDNLYYLADSWVRQKKFEEADPIFVRAITLCEKDVNCKSGSLPVILNEQAKMYTQQHRAAQAESTFKRALEIAQKTSNDALSMEVLDSLALLYKETGRHAEADKMTKQSEKIRARLPPKAA